MKPKEMKIEDVLSLARPCIRDLEPYSTARDECGEEKPEVFLDANESPYENGLNRYPDPRQKALKGKLASVKGISPGSLFLGNGSDEAIDLLYRVFCVPGVDNAVSMAPSYGMYGVAAAMNDVEFRKVLLGDGFALDSEALLSACDGNTKLLFICSPNNPTGNVFPEWQIAWLLERFEGILVLDEAYIDFSFTPSLVPLVDRYPNLVVLQTLSKAWGMAGLRIGLAIARPEVVSLMSKVKYPYNLNVMAQGMALSRLDEAVLSRHVTEVLGQRALLARELRKCPSVKRIYPSEANFLLVEFDEPDAMYRKLLDAGVIVRNRSKVRGCEGCLRITVGTPAENDRLFETLGLKAAGPDSGTKVLGGRHAFVRRVTRETSVTLELNLDKPGISEISTGIPFLDHMLEQIPHHGGVSLKVNASGDLDVDEHHTMEDVAIALGEALNAALGDKLGIGRYGFALPMDDCDALVLLDFGGRTDFRWMVSYDRDSVGGVPTEMFSHFFQSVCSGARCNLHIEARGENAHHKTEAIFKAFARSLRMAVSKSPFPYEIPSSKGVL